MMADDCNGETFDNVELFVDLYVFVHREPNHLFNIRIIYKLTLAHNQIDTPFYWKLSRIAL